MLPIVFQALPKWDGDYNSTALTISTLLSEGRQVFYVEHPYSFLDKYRAQSKVKTAIRMGESFAKPFKDFPNFKVIHPPFTLPLNALPTGSLYRFMIKRYLKELWLKVDQILLQHGIKEFAYINSFDPVYFDIQSKLDCRYKIYHSVDLISGEPYIAKHGVEAESKAAKLADYVITTSYPLRDRLQKHNPNTICIPNAADFKHFSTIMEMPREYRSLREKKIVYTGNIGLRIDYQAIQEIANHYPDYDIVMIGPKDPRYFDGEKLTTLKNLHFLGPRDYKSLPAYLHHADVCLIPFTCNDLTHHIYPLKLNEYMATGKPVVSSRFTDFGDFENYMNIYDADTSALEAIEAAMQDRSIESAKQRIQLSSQNTWDHRLKDWELLLSNLEKSHLSMVG